MSEDEAKEIEYVTTDSTDRNAQNLLRLWCLKNEALQLQCHQKQKESTGSACEIKKEGRTFYGFITCPLPHSLGLLSSSNATNNCSKLGKQGGKIGIFGKIKRANGKLVQIGSKEKLNFQHNLTASQLLQQYREKFIYTRSRLVKAQKQASMITTESKHRSYRKEKPTSKQSSAEPSPRKVPTDHPYPKNNTSGKKSKSSCKKKKKSMHKSNPETKKPRGSLTRKKQLKKHPTRLPIIMSIVNLEGQQFTESSDVITQAFQKKTLSLKKKLNISKNNASYDKKYYNFDQVDTEKLQQKTLYSKINTKKSELIPAIQCNTYSPEVLTDKPKTAYQEHLEEEKNSQQLQAIIPFSMYNIHQNTPRTTDTTDVKNVSRAQVQQYKMTFNDTLDESNVKKSEHYSLNKNYVLDDQTNNLNKNFKNRHESEDLHLPKIKSDVKNIRNSGDITGMLEESEYLLNSSDNDTSIPMRQLMPTIDAFCAKINKQKGKYTLGLKFPENPIKHHTQSYPFQTSFSENVENTDSRRNLSMYKDIIGKTIENKDILNTNVLPSVLANDPIKETEIKNEFDKYKNNLVSEIYKVADEIKQKRKDLFPSTAKNLNSQNTCMNSSLITKGNSLTPLSHLSNTNKTIPTNRKYVVDNLEAKKNPTTISPTMPNSNIDNVIQKFTESRNLIKNTPRLNYKTDLVNKIESVGRDKDSITKTIFTLSKIHNSTPAALPRSKGNYEVTYEQKIILHGKSNLEESNDISVQTKSNASTTEIIKKLTDLGKFRANVPILKDEISYANKTELKNTDRTLDRKLNLQSIFSKNDVGTQDNINPSMKKSNELPKKNLNSRLTKSLMVTSNNLNEESSSIAGLRESPSIQHESVGTESISKNESAQSSPIYRSEYLKYVLTKPSGTKEKHKTAIREKKTALIPKPVQKNEITEQASKNLEFGLYPKATTNSNNFNFKSDKAVEHVQGLMKKIQETESRLQALHEIRTTMDHSRDANVSKDSTIKIP